MSRIFNAGKQLLSEYGSDRIGQLSAAFSYFSLFSIGPLLLVIISLGSFLLGSKAVDGQLHSQLQSTLGDGAATTIERIVAHSYRSHSGTIGLVIGIISLVLGASGLFGQLQSSFDQIFKVKADPRAGWVNIVWPRLKGIVLLVLISALVVATITASAVLSALGKQVTTSLGWSTISLQVLNFGFSAMAIGLLLSFLYKTVPDILMPWRYALCTGFGAGVFFAVGKTILGFVIGHNGTASAYGAAASLIVLLLWVFYTGQIIFVGAEAIKLYGLQRGYDFKAKHFAVKQKFLEVNLPNPYARFADAFQRGFKRGSQKK